MNQSEVSAHEPIIVDAAPIELIEGAARDLKDFNEKILTSGHSPSWGYPRIPAGLALCMGCWHLITASQLGEEQCPGAGRRPDDRRHLRPHFHAPPAGEAGGVLEIGVAKRLGGRKR